MSFEAINRGKYNGIGIIVKNANCLTSNFILHIESSFLLEFTFLFSF